MATPTNYVLRAYPTREAAIQETGDGVTALRVLGDEITGTAATVVQSTGVFTITANQAGGDLNVLFKVGDLLTVTGFSDSDNNVSPQAVTAVTANTITVGAITGGSNETLSGACSFKQSTTVRPDIDNNNQASTFTDESGLNQQYNFFTHEKYYFRLDSVTPATEFYIDWDDGDDNTLKKFDLPQNYAIFEHTYTKHGVFYPMIRIKGADGYQSKYYTTCHAPRSSYRELENKHDLTATQANNISPVQSLSVVSVDSNQEARIPAFYPANYPPTAILKVDRTEVYSGIDNSVSYEALSAANTALDARKRGYVYIDGVDLGIRHTSGIGGGVYNIPALVEVVYINNNDAIVKEVLAGTTGVGASNFPDATFPSDGSALKEIISVKLRLTKEIPYGDVGLSSKQNASIEGLYPDERVWIRLVDSNDVASGHESFALYNPTDNKTVGKSYENFCYVSNGNPYVSVNEPKYFVTADGSESVARNSNCTINRYWLNDDKLRKRDKVGTTGSGANDRNSIYHDGSAPGANVEQATDIFGESVESTTNPKQTLNYKLDYMRGNQLDESEFYATGHDGNQLKGVGRFYDDNRLLRLQVEDSSIDGPDATLIEDVASSGTRGGDAMDFSLIQNHGNYVKPNGSSVSTRPGSLKNNNLLLYRNDTDVWLDMTPRDPYTNLVNFSGSNLGFGDDNRNRFKDATGINSNPVNFLLMAKDRKYNKVFFRMDNVMLLRHINSGNDIPYCKLMAWYSGPSGWKPLPIKDDTATDHIFETGGIGKATSLWRSGTVSWDIPEDWTAVTTADTGYDTNTWATGSDLSFTHGSAAAHSATGLRITASNDRIDGFSATLGGQILEGDKVKLTGSTSNDGTYTVTARGSISGWGGSPDPSSYIEVAESLTDETVSGSASITIYDDTTSGVSSFATPTSSYTIPTSPKQVWNTTNWPQTKKNGPAGGYGIVFGFVTLAANQGLCCYQVTACDTPDSRVIKIVDPKHISLNSAMIAQSVGFSRKGVYHEIKDKFGKSDLRRLGASGGKVSFGGVDLGDNTAGIGSRTRERLVQFQKKGTPVYYDIRHKNGTYTRFFGVINTLSEDMPTGNAPPKFGVNMICTHIIEYDKDGLFTEDIISIGGNVESAKHFAR